MNILTFIVIVIGLILFNGSALVFLYGGEKSRIQSIGYMVFGGILALIMLNIK